VLWSPGNAGPSLNTDLLTAGSAAVGTARESRTSPDLLVTVAAFGPAATGGAEVEVMAGSAAAAAAARAVESGAAAAAVPAASADSAEAAAVVVVVDSGRRMGLPKSTWSSAWKRDRWPRGGLGATCSCSCVCAYVCFSTCVLRILVYV